MSETPPAEPQLAWGRLFGLLSLVWGSAAVAVSLVCVVLGRSEQLFTGLAIGVASLLIAWLAILPLVCFSGDLLCRPAAAHRFIGAALIASTTRLAMTVLLVVVLDKTGTAPRQTIGLWAIFWYSLLIATELVPVADYSTGGRLLSKRSPEEPGAR